MARTVIALYDSFDDASDAVRDLTDHGFSRENISMMAADPSGEYSGYLDMDEEMEYGDDTAAEGAGVGAGIGAVVGGLAGLLVGLGALTIPGVGPVLAAGPLAAALSGLAGAGVGAVAGGVTGGLLGALMDMGIPEESAHYYAEGVRRGGTLVSVRTSDEMANRAVDILDDHNPIDINRRAGRWREEGWTRYDPEAGIYEGEMDVHDTGWEAEPMEMDVQETGWEEEPMGIDEVVEARDFESYAPALRTHYETVLIDTGYTYDQYLPAYRYGYDLASSNRFRDFETWDEMESEARRFWEDENPGTWDRFRSAVRHAWEEVKDFVD